MPRKMKYISEKEYNNPIHQGMTSRPVPEDIHPLSKYHKIHYIDGRSKLVTSPSVFQTPPIDCTTLPLIANTRSYLSLCAAASVSPTTRWWLLLRRLQSTPPAWLVISLVPFSSVQSAFKCRREIYHFPTRINQKFAKTLKQMYY